MRFTNRQIFFSIVVIGLFLCTLRPIVDPDFWWHLRTGQLIVQTRSIPHADPFSFTKAGGAWITHEWLSEVLIYGLFRLGGYGLLIFIFSIIITGAFLLAYLRCPQEALPSVAGLILLLGAFASAPLWGVRPQMISLCITSLFLFLLDRYRRNGKVKFLIPLPLITLIWVNLHAGYFLGLALIGIFIVGCLMEMLLAVFHKVENTAGIPTPKSIMTLCGCLGACILAALANPNGIHIIIYPFQTLTSPSMQQFIQEWFSPDFHQVILQPFAWFILALIGMGMINKKSITPTYILLTLVFGYAALRSVRNIPLFAIIAIPVLAEQVGSLLRIPSEQRAPTRLVRLTGPILLACLVLVTSLRFVQVVQEQPKAEAKSFPKAAVDWMIENKPKGKIFNTYNWGGYLIWRIYPKYRVYIDGRADVYGDEFLFDYASIYRAEPGWDEKLNKQAIQTILVESDSPLAHMLCQLPSWKIVFQDKLSIIFTR
jgi:hypothetical protein